MSDKVEEVNPSGESKNGVQQKNRSGSTGAESDWGWEEEVNPDDATGATMGHTSHQPPPPPPPAIQTPGGMQAMPRAFQNGYYNSSNPGNTTMRSPKSGRSGSMGSSSGGSSTGVSRHNSVTDMQGQGQGGGGSSKRLQGGYNAQRSPSHGGGGASRRGHNTIPSSDSFQELEQAIGATLGTATDSPVTGPGGGAKQFGSPRRSGSRSGSGDWTADHHSRRRYRVPSNLSTSNLLSAAAATHNAGYGPGGGVWEMSYQPPSPLRQLHQQAWAGPAVNGAGGYQIGYGPQYGGMGAVPYPTNLGQAPVQYSAAQVAETMAPFIIPPLDAAVSSSATTAPSHALILLHPPCSHASSIALYGACKRYGALYYYLADHQASQGVTFIAYNDVRAAAAAFEGLSKDAAAALTDAQLQQKEGEVGAEKGEEGAPPTPEPVSVAVHYSLALFSVTVTRERTGSNRLSLSPRGLLTPSTSSGALQRLGKTAAAATSTTAAAASSSTSTPPGATTGGGTDSTTPATGGTFSTPSSPAAVNYRRSRSGSGSGSGGSGSGSGNNSFFFHPSGSNSGSMCPTPSTAAPVTTLHPTTWDECRLVARGLPDKPSLGSVECVFQGFGQLRHIRKIEPVAGQEQEQGQEEEGGLTSFEVEFFCLHDAKYACSSLGKTASSIWAKSGGSEGSPPKGAGGVAVEEPEGATVSFVLLGDDRLDMSQRLHGLLSHWTLLAQQAQVQAQMPPQQQQQAPYIQSYQQPLPPSPKQRQSQYVQAQPPAPPQVGGSQMAPLELPAGRGSSGSGAQSQMRKPLEQVLEVDAARTKQSTPTPPLQLSHNGSRTTSASPALSPRSAGESDTGASTGTGNGASTGTSTGTGTGGVGVAGAAVNSSFPAGIGTESAAEGAYFDDFLQMQKQLGKQQDQTGSGSDNDMEILQQQAQQLQMSTQQFTSGMPPIQGQQQQLQDAYMQQSMDPMQQQLQQQQLQFQLWQAQALAQQQQMQQQQQQQQPKMSRRAMQKAFRMQQQQLQQQQQQQYQIQMMQLQAQQQQQSSFMMGTASPALATTPLQQSQQFNGSMVTNSLQPELGGLALAGTAGGVTPVSFDDSATGVGTGVGAALDMTQQLQGASLYGGVVAAPLQQQGQFPFQQQQLNNMQQMGARGGRGNNKHKSQNGVPLHHQQQQRPQQPFMHHHQQYQHEHQHHNHHNDGHGNGGGSMANNAIDLDAVLSGADQRVTLMIRNIPNKYTQALLLEEVNKSHEGTYDFFYLPIDFNNACNVGYAFISFLQPGAPMAIASLVQRFAGSKWAFFNSEKVCAVTYARIQGKAAMINRFQNSSLLERDDEYRPLLFYSDGPLKGMPEPFPLGSRYTGVQSGNSGGNHHYRQQNQLQNQPVQMHQFQQPNLTQQQFLQQYDATGAAAFDVTGGGGSTIGNQFGMGGERIFR